MYTLEEVFIMELHFFLCYKLLLLKLLLINHVGIIGVRRR